MDLCTLTAHVEGQGGRVATETLPYEGEITWDDVNMANYAMTVCTRTQPYNNIEINIVGY